GLRGSAAPRGDERAAAADRGRAERPRGTRRGDLGRRLRSRPLGPRRNDRARQARRPARRRRRPARGAAAALRPRADLAGPPPRRARGGNGARAAAAGGRGAQRSWIQIVFRSVNLSRAWIDLSRPKPDWPKPPNGAVMSPMSNEFTQTTPARRARAARWARSTSSVQTAAARP